MKMYYRLFLRSLNIICQACFLNLLKRFGVCINTIMNHMFNVDISEYDNIKKAKLQDIVLYGYCDYALLYDEGLYVCYEQTKYGKLIETIKQKYKVSDVRIIY